MRNSLPTIVPYSGRPRAGLCSDYPRRRHESIEPYRGWVRRIVDVAQPDSPNGKEVITPPSRAEWREWLASNWGRKEGLWVVHRKKRSPLIGPLYDELVEEALCFGWIDSQSRRVDDDRKIQWFSPRRSGGLWSALNKERIERLQQDGRMTEMGQAVIDQAMASGSWSQADQADALVIPPDLEAAFAVAPAAKSAFEQLVDSAKKQYLWSVYSAKRPETRAKRVDQLIRDLSAE